MQKGTIVRGATSGKVIAKETVTTKAGTFDTYKIVFTERETIHATQVKYQT
ncbi:hypothetical protein MPC4_130055 [Methylocella tundrae]|uniref:Uncharacterized protein n=1 Tax=Methylocella tundrae TaxID=227605 RepID=A0A8B6M2M3_METTU|nr:hypothetical protein MPC1_7770003 [Methylocella tundrae]VTZ49034.1 hypothetical protein MPC4_130055 [Methylocella tundrae]